MESTKFCENFLQSGKSEKIMHLKIFVSGDDELKQIYLKRVENHNNNLINNQFIDAGFDLVTPLQTEDQEEKKEEVIKCYGPNNSQNKNPVNKIDFKIKCSARMMVDINRNNQNIKYYYTGFYLDPRSSISKTKLRLANSRGIIDAGYRGNLIGMFDVVNTNPIELPDADYSIKKYDCLLQICAPGLVPIFVEIVDKVEDLGSNTERGEGGFGSTSSN
jgi:dUTPase